MFPTWLHSALLRRSSVEPTPAQLTRRRLTALLSLIPATACGIFAFGWYAGLVVLTCLVSAYLTDLIFGRFIFKQYAELFAKFDVVWLMTGLLIALMLPPTMPLYLAALGSIIAIIVGRYWLQVNGSSLIQPALIGLLTLHVLCPIFFALGVSNARMNLDERWPVLRNAPRGDIRNAMNPEIDASNDKVITDALAAPRPQDLVAASSGRDWSHVDYPANVDGGRWNYRALAHLVESSPGNDWLKLLLGGLSGTIGASSGLALILGALLIFGSRAVSPLTSFSALASMFAGLMLFAWLGSRVVYGNIPIHLLSGGTLLALFYFASDPAILPRSAKGRICAGILFGATELFLRLVFKMSDGLPLSLLATQAMSLPLNRWFVTPVIK